jgi:hypothetical protein
MENVIGSASLYQEFRLDEQSCPVPYLKLIQTTPRIYGNGAQDYYSPAIKVERYDGVAGPEHLADFFPKVVADLDPIPGRILSDPSQGSWQGTRFVGPTAIAIKRQGKVVGLHQRVGRVEKESLPASVKVRDPALDLRKGWVAIDFGASSTVVGLRTERAGTELLRIGAGAPASRPRELESPTEIAFLRVGGALKAWRERVVLPATRWEDARVGYAAREHRTAAGPDAAERAASTLVQLPQLRERIERKEPVRLRGLLDPDTNELLKRPAPPVIDEDGIGRPRPVRSRRAVRVPRRSHGQSALARPVPEVPRVPARGAPGAPTPEPGDGVPAGPVPQPAGRIRALRGHRTLRGARRWRVSLAVRGARDARLRPSPQGRAHPVLRDRRGRLGDLARRGYLPRRHGERARRRPRARGGAPDARGRRRVRWRAVAPRPRGDGLRAQRRVHGRCVDPLRAAPRERARAVACRARSAARAEPRGPRQRDAADGPAAPRVRGQRGAALPGARDAARRPTARRRSWRSPWRARLSPTRKR